VTTCNGASTDPDDPDDPDHPDDSDEMVVSASTGKARHAHEILALVVVAVAACGSRHAGMNGDGGDDDDGSHGPRDGSVAGADDAGVRDAGLDASLIDAFPAVLDLHINCRNDCVLVADPPSISVTAGTSFKVNWINVGDTECDVAKIDPFNAVPIILGLEPGMSYLDPVHDWCGQLFTGTFDFQIRICTLPSNIPVDCGSDLPRAR